MILKLKTVLFFLKAFNITAAHSDRPTRENSLYLPSLPPFLLLVFFLLLYLFCRLVLFPFFLLLLLLFSFPPISPRIPSSFSPTPPPSFPPAFALAFLLFPPFLPPPYSRPFLLDSLLLLHLLRFFLLLPLIYRLSDVFLSPDLGN